MWFQVIEGKRFEGFNRPAPSGEIVVVVVKIGGHALLRIGQVAENRPLPRFELFGFVPRPQALGLRIFQVLGPPALET